MKQIIFAGGIHGAGKSTLCQEVTSKLNIQYLSASEVLKWKDINTDEKNKKVADIPDTQNRLVKGLKAVVEVGKKYLLDGHYCLFNQEGKVIQVPMDTFTEINPVSLILVTNSISIIKAVLEQRDKKNYDIELLKTMQDHETSYAYEIAKTLNVPLFIFDKQVNNIENLILKIHESLT